MQKKETFLDLYRYTGDYKLKSWIKYFFFNPGFTYTVFFRISKSKNTILKIFSKIMLKILSILYHFQIPSEVEIKEGFYIGHFGSIVINPKVKIGKNVNIAQGVTIGQTNRGKLMGTPIIGDEVWIGTNSVIVGKIKIGNNVLIAPNSYVNRDIPDNSIVFGNPLIIKYNEKATDDYINKKI